MAAAPTDALDRPRTSLAQHSVFFAEQYPRASNICIGQTMCAYQTATAKVSIYAASQNYICQILKAVMLEGVKHNLFALL
ncbi:hypothetical protein N9M28_04265 [Luminiphilus sp.]|nr:hypothetical protein [Luminiphilus sp.]MDA9798418.1 hypothetical protein [Luminiphilus sp.]